MVWTREVCGMKKEDDDKNGIEKKERVDINQKIIEELLPLIPEDMHSFLRENEGAAKFLEQLPQRFPPQSVITNPTQPPNQRAWELVGLHYKNHGHTHEALALFSLLYQHMLDGQKEVNTRVHKGMPLCFIADCYKELGCPVLSKRFLMQTLCEDAIAYEGSVSPKTSGTYFRLIWLEGMSHSEFTRYSQEIYNLSKEKPNECSFPEWILQQLDQDWMTDIPSLRETQIYSINHRYLEYLLSLIDDPTGKTLEDLASYLLSCIPGCKTKVRERTHSTDYDIVCYMEGLKVDFREDIDRYFVCECKNWKDPADFTTFAKFCRVLDSIKSKFGIVFSREGISGAGRTENAEREQLKVFQDRGMVIVVIDLEDITRISEGYNFIVMLREKYKKIRLDLQKGQ